MLCSVCCIRSRSLKVWPIYINAVFPGNLYQEFGGFLNYTTLYLSFYIAVHKHFSGSSNIAGINQRGSARASDRKVEIFSYCWGKGMDVDYRSKFRKRIFKKKSGGFRLKCPLYEKVWVSIVLMRGLRAEVLALGAYFVTNSGWCLVFQALPAHWWSTGWPLSALMFTVWQCFKARTDDT